MSMAASATVRRIAPVRVLVTTGRLAAPSVTPDLLDAGRGLAEGSRHGRQILHRQVKRRGHVPDRALEHGRQVAGLDVADRLPAYLQDADPESAAMVVGVDRLRPWVTTRRTHDAGHLPDRLGQPRHVSPVPEP